MPYAFANGAGTEADPYQVWTAEDLDGVRDYLDAHFIQMADIDLSGYTNWVPIGDEDSYFTGVYNGGGFKITSLSITASTSAGLFGSGNNCSLKNIWIEDCHVSGLSAGGLICLILDSGNIDKCLVTGQVEVSNSTSSTYCGGLIGMALGPIAISNCYAICNLTINFIKTSWNTATAGGLSAYGGVIDGSYAACSITVTDFPAATGGLIGAAGTVTNSYYDTTISGQSDTGKGTPKTTLEMKQQSTYVGWDFDTVWGIDPAINDGYPYLLVFSQAEPEEPEEPIIDDVIPQYVPQSSIKLTFTAGDSDPYDMGTYYADSSHHKVGQDFTRINARNSVGKYLKDQSFDENCNYPAQAGHDLLESILSAAGLTNYYVAANATQLGFNFPPNKLLLDGLEEVIQYLSDWQIREEVTGRVVIGPKDDPEFTQPSTYTFQRDRDIFSREQVVDDRSIYGRVCVHTGDFTVKVYRPITSNLGWSPPARKTLYQKVPDGTTSQEAAAIATSLATAMSNSGRIETFVCAFRPQLIPGDEAQILDSSGAVSLGIITQVKHTFGTQGFYSEIVVDSGGRIGKIKFKDIVNSLQPLPETVKN